MIKVLIIDDSALVRKLLAGMLSDASEFQVETARNGAEGLERLHAFRPNVVTLDVHMPQMNGFMCLDRIMLERPTPVVMVSSVTSQSADETLQALRLGAFDFVAKPSGTLSLRVDQMKDDLLDKIRTAAVTGIKPTLRLQERIRHRIGQTLPTSPHPAPIASKEPIVKTGVNGLVLIGVSTGGPPALEAVVGALPASFSWPILVAQHMPESFTGALAKRLNSLSAIEIVEVTRPTEVVPGVAYIARGGADMIVSRRGGVVFAMNVPSQVDYPWHPSADRLVRSAMEQIPPSDLIGILMTGMGNDGASAMKLLHERGGTTIAEAEETAVVWGMPGELVKGGGADWILPLPEIARQLMKVVPCL
ncbi:chemotaxis-specific protein-glutamate methyltransferase CheB [Mesorhizobium sp. M0317]|uniref:chemotaxis-specific protein-glutamate methyltransferase CheB n=4 Tax=Mesorhizobium TaxID=68287 RepID=UPI0003CFCC49|nr:MULTISPECIES: chemotaxis-specific protein-glutamate methyltransferase CheB [unclassified Mesorhizobium]ESY99131.1 chemotaxis protein CheY [Mesorhizobium sp. L2C089B000]ESZ34504.1 chemotaxis protein CheY [Mesorhizobium sp. L2C054A000]WJI50243.1 chemotaxis-specific protein-glutamate methyltransferase CheB [Mesorhizobium sp. C089B]